MTENLFGPIVSNWLIEQRVIETLRSWMPEYIAELERKEGLPHGTIPRPPAPESVHGGIDMESWTQDTTPQVIVVVKPQGRPDNLRGDGSYGQGYDIEVGCACVSTGSELAERPEDDARATVAYLGAASMLLVQKPILGGITEQLHMTGAPTVSAPNPDRKDIALCTTTFEMWVSAIIEEGKGPVTELPREAPEFPGKEEPWPEGPEVKTAKETLTVKRVTEEV